MLCRGPEVDEDTDEQPNRNQADRKALSPQQVCTSYVKRESLLTL